MVQSESIAKIYPALIKALGELTSVQNNAENTHFKTKYSTLSATQDIFRPVLAKYDLGLIQSVTSDNGKYKVTTKLIHSSGEFMSDQIDLLISQNSMQGLGSAITYSKRYMAQALLNMSGTNDDDDGSEASKSDKGKNENKAKQSQDQKPNDDKPREKLAPKDVVYPFESSIKGKKIGDVETATLEKAASWLKGELAKDPKPQNNKQIAFIYAQVKAVLIDRNPPPDDIPENIDPKTGELYPEGEPQSSPDYENQSQEPGKPDPAAYVIPSIENLSEISDLVGKPLKQISEGELRAFVKILDGEMKKTPPKVNVSALFEVRSKVVEFFKSMDLSL